MLHVPGVLLSPGSMRARWPVVWVWKHFVAGRACPCCRICLAAIASSQGLLQHASYPGTPAQNSSRLCRGPHARRQLQLLLLRICHGITTSLFLPPQGI